jgi:hypothetical protein
MSSPLDLCWQVCNVLLAGQCKLARSD